MNYAFWRIALPLSCLLVGSGCSRSDSGQPAAPGAAARTGKPVAVSVLPQSGSGASQVFTVKFSHGGGYKQLANVRLLINAEAMGSHACYVYYDLPSNSFLLVNDSTPGSTGVVLGTGGSVQNSQCTVSTEGASAVGQGDDLAVTIPIKFKPAFAGVKKLILFADATDGANTDLVLKGEYTVTP
jgi:hypothetical protein